MILIYTTCKNLEEAKKISKELLNKKLIACSNFFPMNSMYRWKGEINEDNEYILILKTMEEKFKEIKEEIKKLHSYECPCIIKLEADCNKEFLEFIKKEIKN